MLKFSFLPLCHQMSAAMNREFSDVVERLFIIDCRYPYEYEGGHIKVRMMLFFVLIFRHCFVFNLWSWPQKLFIEQYTKFEILYVTLHNLLTCLLGCAKLSSRGPGWGVLFQTARSVKMPWKACAAGVPLWVFFRTWSPDVPLCTWARSFPQWISQSPLPWTVHTKGRLQRLLSPS